MVRKKNISKKIVSRKILKKSKTTYKIPEYHEEGIWEDENRFFKGAVKNEFI